MIINHSNTSWKRKNNLMGNNKHNGARYYSIEICDRIIPNVKTDRNWITVNVPGCAADHSIFFIHSNKTPAIYEWLREYKDIVLVCGVPETVEMVKNFGTPIYLPLSIDVEYVKQFMVPEEERRGVAFVGRQSKARYDGVRLPRGIDYISGLKREALLSRMARYKSVYAVGRVAIEAKALGLEVLPYDPRFPDPEFWKVIDNLEAAEMLQKKLDEIDG